MIEFLMQIYSWIEMMGRDIIASFEAVASVIELAPTVLIGYSSAMWYLPLPLRLYGVAILGTCILFILIGQK